MRHLLYTCLILLFCFIFSPVNAQIWECACKPTDWITLGCSSPAGGYETYIRFFPDRYEVLVNGQVVEGQCPPSSEPTVRYETCYDPSYSPCVPATCNDFTLDVYKSQVPLLVSDIYSGPCGAQLSKNTFSCLNEGPNTVDVLDAGGNILCSSTVTVNCLACTSCDGISNVVLPPSSVDATLTSSIGCTDDNGWTYYEHPTIPEKYIFAINWAPDGSLSNLNRIARNNASVSIDVLNSYHEASDANGGSFMMGRYWNVNNSTAFDEAVQIRFYYDPAEITSITNAATAFANSNGLIDNGLTWFKQNSAFDPTIDNSPSFQPDVRLIPSAFGVSSNENYVEFDGITSFSGGGVIAGTGTALPVELMNFEGRAFENNVILNWETASELNNEKFEIEESYNGVDFRKIGEVQGNGTTTEQKNYSFKIEWPRNGISYYRLKQIDFDGQYEYSKIISVDLEGEREEVGDFYPNPSKSGQVQLSYISQNDLGIVVSVFDATGKLVMSQIQQVSIGTNNLSFDFSKLNTGIYIVRIGNAENPTFRKLIIK